MASFFISHSSRDNVAAEQVEAWLERQGFASVFLDFDPEVGIPAGRHWEDELYSQLRKADVVIFLATRAAARSKWCHAELVLSRSLGRTIVPVLLEPGAKHPLVSDTQWVRVELNGNGSLRPLADALKRLHIDPLDTLSWNEEGSPYPGLAPFDEERAGVFYAREEEIRGVLGRLRAAHAEGSERLVLVAGPSGSGKSSLLRAGVIPRLRLHENGWITLPTLMPEEVPLEQLARSIANTASALGRDMTWQECRDRFARGAGALKELARDLLDAAGSGSNRGVLLSVDQGEKLVTQCPAAARVAFLDLLSDGLQGATPLRAVITLRSEYLSELLAGTAFEGTLAPVITLGRLSPGRLAEVIERPAQRAGIDYEDGLVARMVQDTASRATGGDPLPLLAFTLRQLYEHRAEPTRITSDDYARVGGVIGALKEEANRAREQLGRRGLDATVVPTLLELVHVEADREPTGRSVKRSRFTGAGRQVVDAFVDARLLTTDGDDATVHVAHEALLREWPVLVRAIDQSRDQLVTRSRLERDAREWEAAGRDPSYLIGGRRLKTAIGALSTDGRSREPTAAAFVEASKHRAFRQVWRTRLVVALVALLAVGGGVYGVRTLLDRIQEAERQDAARGRMVTLPSGAEIDRHEVTGHQYHLCVVQGRCKPPDDGGRLPWVDSSDKGPAVNVEPLQARTFCAWIGRQLPKRAELTAAASAHKVTYLLKQGGYEWTSNTNRAGAYLRVPHLPGGTEIYVAWNQSYPDTGFRCAQSRHNG